jgi:hypothetical protein
MSASYCRREFFPRSRDVECGVTQFSLAPAKSSVERLREGQLVVDPEHFSETPVNTLTTRQYSLEIRFFSPCSTLAARDKLVHKPLDSGFALDSSTIHRTRMASNGGLKQRHGNGVLDEKALLQKQVEGLATDRSSSGSAQTTKNLVICVGGIYASLYAPSNTERRIQWPS